MTAGPTSDLGHYVNFPRLLQSSQTRMIQRNRVERGEFAYSSAIRQDCLSVCGSCSRDL